jgi:dephospho-CoA kinase
VTSSLAAGKSTLLSLAEKHGFAVINTDALTHQLLNSPNPAYEKVLARFKNITLVNRPGGPIDRPRLAAVIFTDPSARKDLEQILHPAVRELCAKQIAALPDDAIAIVEVPLLFEAGLESDYDETLALVVNPDIQMQRLLQRPGMTEDHAKARIAAQMSQVEKAKRATYVIDNSGTLEEFEASFVTFAAAASERAANKENARKQPKEKIKEPWECEPNKTKTPADKPKTNCPDKGKTPADTGVPTPVDTNKSPDQGKVVPQPQPEPDIDDATAAATNQKLQDALKSMSGTVSEKTLEQLGDLGRTKHKEANASMSLSVGSREDKKPGTGHELNVDMRMSIKRTDGSPSCRCGCVNNCRAGCACKSNCGCSCAEPKPPVPPAPPAPPVPVNGKGCEGGRNTVLIVAIVAIVALVALGLGFLAWNKSPVGTNGGGNTTIVVSNPPGPCSSCQDVKPSRCLTCGSGTVIPSVPPPAAKVCAPGSNVENPAKIPGFAFQFTPNVVRMSVATWTVKVESGCQSATVVGTDSKGRLVTSQQYGADLAFMYRWDVTYETGRVQVDRFETYGNAFVGRSVYVYNADATGKLSNILQFDGHQRLLTDATLSSNTVSMRRFEAGSGSATGSQSYDGAAANAALSSNFYLFETFKQ